MPLGVIARTASTRSSTCVGPDGEVPAGARRDPASEGRELEGLRVEAHGQPVSAELLLQPRARGAGADARGARDRVDLEHPVERAEIERRRAVERRRDPRLDAADDARAAAVGDHGDVRARRPFEGGLHVRLAARADDEVDDVLVAPAEGADRVDVGLAEAVAGAVAVVDRADRGQRARDGDPRRRQRGRRQRLLDLGRAKAERLDDAGGRGPRLGRADDGVLEPPSPAVACARHRRADPMLETDGHARRARPPRPRPVAPRRGRGPLERRPLRRAARPRGGGRRRHRRAARPRLAQPRRPRRRGSSATSSTTGSSRCTCSPRAGRCAWWRATRRCRSPRCASPARPTGAGSPGAARRGCRRGRGAGRSAPAARSTSARARSTRSRASSTRNGRSLPSASAARRSCACRTGS